MSLQTVLFVCPEVKLRDELREPLAAMPIDLIEADSTEKALRTLAEANPRIAVVSDTLGDASTLQLLETLRKTHHREPFQVILLVKELREDILERYLNRYVDDFHLVTSPGVGLSLRLQAALRRNATHDEVAGEREFYRRAAKQEEELTSRALDEALALRDQALSVSATSRFNPVTGLLSEQSLVDEIDREIERAVRSLNSLAGFVLSIDEQEKLTRTHGTDAMERLLRRVGRAFDHGLRRYDLAGHYGKEAILTALPGADLATATVVANRFRSVLTRLVSQVSGLPQKVTFSFGVAVFSGSEAKEQWIARAANSLARARSLGGDRVETDDRPANAYALWKASRVAQPGA